MFSTAQQSYIDSYLVTMHKLGYKYYIAYTDSTSSAFGTQHADLYLIFSKDIIRCTNGYVFTVPDGSTQFAIFSGNSNTGAQRVTQSDKSGTVRVDTFEHVYTNADYSSASLIQPDYSLTSRGELMNHVDGASFILLCCLFVFAAICFIRKLFSR